MLSTAISLHCMLDSVVFHLDIAVTVRLLFKKIAADCLECYINDMAKRLYSSAFFLTSTYDGDFGNLTVPPSEFQMV